MRFTKMHGTGNDYVYVDGFAERLEDPAAVAVKVSDRHFGIGSDGLILIGPSDRADVRMRMFNADGSEAEMCGNGVRCVAKFAFDHGLATSNPMTVETGRGVLGLSLHLGPAGRVESVTVNMSRPILSLADIPVDPAHIEPGGERTRVPARSGGRARHARSGVRSRWETRTRSFSCRTRRRWTCRSWGRFSSDTPPSRGGVNVHFVEVVSPGEVIVRTWERGSGITLACGTGACAVAIAGAITGRTGRTVLAHLPGGDLSLEWREADDCIYMTGQAAEVFSGTIDI